VRRFASSASRSRTPTSGNATDGPALSEEEHEVTLHAEQPVVEKTVVPKERVRLEKDTFTEEQTVTDEVRKERIEADGDAGKALATPFEQERGPLAALQPTSLMEAVDR
jgi:stress response protein YsnF